MPARRYAEETKIEPKQSRDDIERLLKSHGAQKLLFYEETGKAVIQCILYDRMVRWVLEIPHTIDFRYSPGARWRNDRQMMLAWEQEQRRRWRALLLIIKAKLEIVEYGGATNDEGQKEADFEADFEKEFLANIVLPDNSTVGEHASTELRHAYETGQMPALFSTERLALPAPSSY